MTRAICQRSDARTPAERRVAALDSYGILDGEPDPGLDALAALAAQICDVPFAAVTLLDADRQWFKAITGIDVSFVEIENAFCRHALDTPDQVLVVPDATADARFADNPMVIGPPGVRSYAGAPLVTPDGVAIGTMCAIDQRTRRLTPQQIQALTSLADLAVELLEARRNARVVVETEGSFHAAFDHAAVGMLLESPAKAIIRVNPAFAAMLGYEPSELVGATLSDVTSEEDLAAEVTLMNQVITGQTPQVVREKRYRHRDGTSVTAVSSTTVIRDDTGAASAVLSHVESIEDRRRAEQTLLETQSATDAIITADADGMITAWNDGAQRLFGHTRSQALGQPVANLVPEPFRTAHRAAISRVLARSSSRLVGQTVEMDGLRRDGGVFPVELSLSKWELDGRPRFTAIVRDITERRRLHDELVRQANTDALTGVGNRSWFTNEVASTLWSQPVPLSLLVLELQGLREVDDSLGLLLGDHILVEVADRLRATLRPQDRLARIDNGDFAVLLPDTRPAKAAAVARRLRDAIPAHFRIRSAPVPISACVGLANHRGGASPSRAAGTAARLLRNATLALAAARKAPSCVAVYAPVMSARAQRRLTLHGALEGAIDRHELTLAYQPLVDLVDNSLHGVEALARWSHPKLGVINPAEFIPLAEDTGLATRLGAWVLREACQQAVRWSLQLAEPLPISVNVSGHQLMDPAIADTIFDVLASTGLDPALLTLEITESVLMSDPEAVRDRLTAIRALGCKTAIDDFGTGHSTLASLTRFPIDELKIAQSFVDALPHDGATEQVTRAIVDLARNLELRTVAEGIETSQQRHMLTAIGCTIGQGYLFARPMPADAVIGWQHPTLAVVRQETAAG